MDLVSFCQTKHQVYVIRMYEVKPYLEKFVNNVLEDNGFYRVVCDKNRRKEFVKQMIDLETKRLNYELGTRLKNLENIYESI